MYYSFRLCVADDTQVVLADSNYIYSEPVLKMVTAVLARLNRHLQGLGARRVFVQDAEGCFRELRHDHGKFLSIKPVSASQHKHIQTLVDSEKGQPATVLTNLPE